MWSQTTGTRALQRWKLCMAFIKAKAQNMFEAELAGSFKAASLDEVTSGIDQVTADEQNARWKMEHAEAYCLARDHRYGRRSRRWLYARALATKLDSAYVEWGAFVRENDLSNPDISQLPAEDFNTLSQKTYQEVMKP
jgi:hypothetical protein